MSPCTLSLVRPNPTRTMQQQMAHRLQSGSLASCSGRHARPLARVAAVGVVAPRVDRAPRRRLPLSCRASSSAAADDVEEEEEEDGDEPVRAIKVRLFFPRVAAVVRADAACAGAERGPACRASQAPAPPRAQASFFELGNPNNREPNFADPEWYEKVTDWREFWNYTRWELEAEDTEDGFDDTYDVDGYPTRSTERAMEMLAAFRQVEARPDVMNIVTSAVRDDAARGRGGAGDEGPGRRPPRAARRLSRPHVPTR